MMSKRKMVTMDGNTAAAYISYPFTEVAAIYPITPSSPMAEIVDSWSADGKKNFFGKEVRVVEMQSEAGASGALHGVLQTGVLGTTYTASQGLLLMIPNMYRIAGELLPAVFHVSARSIASNYLSIFGDQQDVMSARPTGFAMLASSTVQDIMFLGGIAHLAAIKSSLPFIHFFDGFRTSHEIQKIEVLDMDDLYPLIDQDALKAFHQRALHPKKPAAVGMAINPDVYFQLREAMNPYYDAVPEIVQHYMDEINKLTGRDYKLFNYYGVPDADRVCICIGSACSVLEEAVDTLNAAGQKVGLINVHLYRPFSVEYFLSALPTTVKKIAVLDRTKEPGGCDPLLLDVRSAFYGREKQPLIVGGRYGLASKDFTPGNAFSVYENLLLDQPMDDFTVGIIDDVTNRSLPAPQHPLALDTTGCFACKFWGYGSDGTVGANKMSIKIIGDHTDQYAQAYFSYDSKKSGGVTISHVRFGKQPIRSSYMVNNADFVACHKQAYLTQYDMLSDLKEGGTFLLNCTWKKEELEQHLPNTVKKALVDKKIKFYVIDAIDIASQIGIGKRINMIMQSAFFKVVPVIDVEDAKAWLKESVAKTYAKKGQEVINMNWQAIDQGMEHIEAYPVPAEWSQLEPDVPVGFERPEFIRTIVDPMARQQGDFLPVSKLMDCADGQWPVASTAWEKRGISEQVPTWIADNCIQCNQCAFACPHSVIRPRLLTAKEVVGKPESMEIKTATGYKDMFFHLSISGLDCTGCGICIQTCPTKEKAIVMRPFDEVIEDNTRNWNYAEAYITDKPQDKSKLTVKSSQFLRPLFEFSGACPGCGETPYAKLLTQLFGDRMLIANAAGCSGVWAAGSPSVSYTVDDKGHGPAWATSLFEDCAEYGFGMKLGSDQQRRKVHMLVIQALAEGYAGSAAEAMQAYLDGEDSSEGTWERAEALEKALDDAVKTEDRLQPLYELKKFFVLPSQWIFGGDGWAYDIGFGGLDHILSCNENVNILVFDTEVYSNTGGQASKSTPASAIAQFEAGGKVGSKKDLGRIAMCYGNVYVAQIALGANKTQTLKALIEAESYPGTSIVIAYAPCINHGIKGGMTQAQEQTKRAVESGYWTLYRYDPRKKEQGINPFTLDSNVPSASYIDHLMSEVRYASLARKNGELAKQLFEKSKRDAQSRYQYYEHLSKEVVDE